MRNLKPRTKVREVGEIEIQSTAYHNIQYKYIYINKQQSDEREKKNWQKMLNFNEENRVNWNKKGEKERQIKAASNQNRIEAKNNFPGEKIQKKWNKRALLQ